MHKGDRAYESEGPNCIVCVRVTVLVSLKTELHCVCVWVTVLVSLRDLLA